MSMRTLITIVDLEHSRTDGGPGLESLERGDELYNAVQHAIEKRRRFERPTEDGIGNVFNLLSSTAEFEYWM